MARIRQPRSVPAGVLLGKHKHRRRLDRGHFLRPVIVFPEQAADLGRQHRKIRRPRRNAGVGLSYEAMADDSAALMKCLGIAKADFMGYSGELVVVSTTFRRDGWYPEVVAAM